MNPFWHNLFTLFFVLSFVLIHIAGLAAFGAHANAVGGDYLNRHPLLDGEPFFESKYADRFALRRRGGPVWRVYREPQADPELERLRQEFRRRARHGIFWHFGFPLVAMGVMTLLNLAGYIG